MYFKVLKRRNLTATPPKDFVFLLSVEKWADGKQLIINEQFFIKEDKIIFSGSYSQYWIIGLFQYWWEGLFPEKYLLKYYPINPQATA